MYRPSVIECSAVANLVYSLAAVLILFYRKLGLCVDDKKGGVVILLTMTYLFIWNYITRSVVSCNTLYIFVTKLKKRFISMKLLNCIMLIIAILFLPIIDVLSHTHSEEIFDYSTFEFDTEYIKMLVEDTYHWSDLNDKSYHVSDTHVSSSPKTYFFSIVIPDSLVGERFSIYPGSYMGDDFDIYVNGKLCMYSGPVDHNTFEEDSNVEYATLTTVSFIADTSLLQVQVCINSAVTFSKDIFYPLYFGLADVMDNRQEKAIFQDLFIIAGLIITSLYHFFVYSVNRSEPKVLCFSLLCFLLAIGHCFQDTFCILIIFPDRMPSFYVSIYLSVMSMSAAMALLFFRSVFPGVFSNRVLVLILITSLLLVLFAHVGNEVMQYYIIRFTYGFVIAVILYTYNGIYHLWKKKVKGVAIFTFTISFFCLCFVDKTFNLFPKLEIIHLMDYGLTAFVLTVSYSYGMQTRKKFHKTQEVLLELEKLTDGLETEVTVRTKELSESLSKLSRFNHFQEGMTHMIAHDIKGPLMQIINLGRISASDFPYLRHAGVTMFRMIENMIVLYKYNNNTMYVNYTSFWVHHLVEDVLRDFVFCTTQKALTIEIIYDYEFEINADVHIFRRVIGNLLSNAFRFSPNEGVVQISLSAAIDNSLRVSVTNEGPALDAKTCSNIFQHANVCDHERDDKHRVSGLGLYLCHMAINAHKGDIGVVSDGVQGVEFWFVLPGVLTMIEKKVCKQLFASINHNLTSEDKMYLLPYAKELSKFEVFDTTKIEAVISRITDTNESITRWVDNIEKACYALDEAKFFNLTQVVHEST